MTPGKGSKYREFYDLSGRITCMATKEDSYIKSDESFCAYDGQLLVFSSMKSSG